MKNSQFLHIKYKDVLRNILILFYRIFFINELVYIYYFKIIFNYYKNLIK